MPASPARRVNYFERQFIRLPELQDEQSYHLTLRRRHNLSHHTWGIVLGLEIVLENEVAVVRPGLAVDGYGRELLLVNRKLIDRSVFDQYATTRLDLWLEYQLELADDRSAPFECESGDPRQRYRAIERAEISIARAGAARIDAKRPVAVAAEDLDETALPVTPDDPRKRWPVYLGRVTLQLDAAGKATFVIDTADRVYAGLRAALIDHPGTPARIELGQRPSQADTRRIGDTEFTYAAGAARDFAVFVPPDDPSAVIQPTIAVDGTGTALRGGVHAFGNVVLDGSSLQFPDSVEGTPDTAGNPALYRSGGELRIDLGNLDSALRRLVLGVTKDNTFHPALEISFRPGPASSQPQPIVTVHGDLRLEGTIDSKDSRARTVTPEVMALLNGMVQAGITVGGGG